MATDATGNTLSRNGRHPQGQMSTKHYGAWGVEPGRTGGAGRVGSHRLIQLMRNPKARATPVASTIIFTRSIFPSASVVGCAPVLVRRRVYDAGAEGMTR